MSGDSWNTLKQCVEKFSKYKKSQQSEDLISIILYDDRAEQFMTKQKISQIDVNLPNLRGGGTNFQAAFSEAEKIIELTPKQFSPAIIFLTDGIG